MLHEQFEQQNVANSTQNEKLEFKNAANTVETSASSSKMLQIARKTGRNTDQICIYIYIYNRQDAAHEPECSHVGTL